MAYHTHSRQQMIDIVARKFLLAGDDPATVRAEVAQMDDGTLQVLVRGILEAAPEEARGALTEHPESFRPADGVTDFARGAATTAGGASRALATGLGQTGEAIGGVLGRAGEALGSVQHEGPMNNIYNIALRAGLNDEGARVARVIAQHVEGGMTGAVGDRDRSPVGSHGPFQFYGPGGQLDNFARDRGLSLAAAGQYARDNPAVAAEWALKGYLGRAIRAGQAQGLHGAELATWVQANGQRSEQPERAGRAFGQFGGETIGPSLGGGGAPMGIRDPRDLGGLGPPTAAGTLEPTIRDYIDAMREARRAYVADPTNRELRIAYQDAMDEAKTAAARGEMAGVPGALGFREALKELSKSTEDMTDDFRRVRLGMTPAEQDTSDRGWANYWLSVETGDRAARQEARQQLIDMMNATGNIPESMGGGRTIAAQTFAETLRRNEENERRLALSDEIALAGVTGEFRGAQTRSAFESDRTFDRLVENEQRNVRRQMATDFSNHAMRLYEMQTAAAQTQAAQDKIRIPAGQEYLRGEEPGGSIAALWARLGLPHTPRRVEDYGVPLRDPYEHVNAYMQSVGPIYQNHPGNPLSPLFQGYE